LVDLFVLLLAPAGGDQLQGIKKGVIELADLLVVTKADGVLAGAASEALAEYRAALGLLRPGAAGPRAQALTCSALTGTGLEELWQEIERARAARQESGAWQGRRSEQAGVLLAAEIGAALLSEFRADARIAAAYPEFQLQLSEGKLTPSEAARHLLALRAPK
jgi:LAO/AO transport system kinase